MDLRKKIGRANPQALTPLAAGPDQSAPAVTM